MRTQILYEDEDLLVCLKPAGLAVQSARPAEPDMQSELKNYLAGANRAAGRREPVYLGIVHRLDQPVSGLLVFGKNRRSAALLSAQTAGNGMEKIYRAAVALPAEPGSAAGELREVPGGAAGGIREASPSKDPAGGRDVLRPGRWTELTDHLLREPDGARVAGPEEPGAKPARLAFTCLEAKRDRALLEIRLYTGRYHQIRLQLAHAGMPILGDGRYATPASRALSERLSVRNIQLQAVKLAFTHPRTGKRVCYELENKLELS